MAPKKDRTPIFATPPSPSTTYEELEKGDVVKLKDKPENPIVGEVWFKSQIELGSINAPRLANCYLVKFGNVGYAGSDIRWCTEDQLTKMDPDTDIGDSSRARDRKGVKRTFDRDVKTEWMIGVASDDEETGKGRKKWQSDIDTGLHHVQGLRQAQYATESWPVPPSVTAIVHTAKKRLANFRLSVIPVVCDVECILKSFTAHTLQDPEYSWPDNKAVDIGKWFPARCGKFAHDITPDEKEPHKYRELETWETANSFLLELFNVCVLHLLYPLEAAQWEELESLACKEKNKALEEASTSSTSRGDSLKSGEAVIKPSQVYGLEHLLRFLVALPQIMPTLQPQPSPQGSTEDSTQESSPKVGSGVHEEMVALIKYHVGVFFRWFYTLHDAWVEYLPPMEIAHQDFVRKYFGESGVNKLRFAGKAASVWSSP